MSHSSQSPSGAKGTLTRKQREHYAAVFVELDTNADGWMSRKKFSKWIKSQSGFHKTDQEIKTIFRMIDVNCDGRITLDEFFRIMELVEPPPTPKSRDPKAELMFQSMDENGDGFLSVHELHSGLSRCGYNLTRKQIEKCVSNLDTNKDGNISYDEFLMVFHNEKSQKISKTTAPLKSGST